MVAEALSNSPLYVGVPLRAPHYQCTLDLALGQHCDSIVKSHPARFKRLLHFAVIS